MSDDMLVLEGHSPLDALRAAFGYSAFRGPQEEVVEALVRGESRMLLLATGGGKSICYQIPAMVRPGTGLVISPLVSLMDDQVHALRARGIRAAALHGSMEEDDRDAVAARARRGDLDLLYVSPERLKQPGFRELVKSVPLSLVAVDECHVVSSWGHEFRDAYRDIPAFLRRLPEGVPVIALTATADAITVSDVRRLLGLMTVPLLRTDFDRPNIRILMHQCDSGQDVQSRALDFLESCRGTSGIVYCATQKNADTWAGLLRSKGYPALAYHAGMAACERAATHRDFIERADSIVVATIAFGMGIDKGNTRWVLHLNLPSSPEGWYQEMGRAGRDGLPATTLLLWTEADAARRRGFMRRAAMEAEARGDQAAKHARFARQRADIMAAMARSSGCRRRAVLSYLDSDPGHACGNCDTCLWPGTVVDTTDMAHAVLSLIGSLDKPLGPHRLADILLGVAGRDTENAASLPGAGCMHGLHRSTARHIIMQCAALGLLRMPPDGQGGYSLSYAGVETLTDLEAGGVLWLAPAPPVLAEEDAPARTGAFETSGISSEYLSGIIESPIAPVQNSAQDVARRLALHAVVGEAAKSRGMSSSILLDSDVEEALLSLRPAPSKAAELLGAGASATLVALAGSRIIAALCRNQRTQRSASKPLRRFLQTGMSHDA